MKRILISCAALALALGSASANTITYSGWGVDGLNEIIDYPITAVGPLGVIQLNKPTGGVLYAWSVDIFHPMQPSGAYDVLASDPSLTTAQIGEIGALIDYGKTFETRWLRRKEMAAIQMAILHIAFGAEYRGDPPGLYYTYLYDATGGVWAPDYNVKFLTPVDGANNQTLAIVDGAYNQTPAITGGVPEASTWVMMTLGFAALGFAAIRQQRAGVA